jgi:hypothetical protein
MKEDYSSLISKKIRNQLIFYTYTELKKNLKKKHHLLINSMTPNELSEKYQKCSDYCVEKTEEYSSSLMNNGIDNNNYFHVSVTYCSFNNNYHMLVDNKNVDQYIGKNNIVGKYYKGNTIQIRTTTDKYKYNIRIHENKLEKKIIGEKKFIKHTRSILSSLGVNKNICIMDKENNIEKNEIEDHINNLNSNCNEEHYKKIINEKININNEKIQTNCENKIRKSNTQKIVNIYLSKLKNYCSKLILTKRKMNIKNNLEINKINEPASPRKKLKDKNHFRSGKERPKIEETAPILNSNVEMNFTKHLNSKIGSENNKFIIHGKLKSQTKINQNLYRLPGKRSFYNKKGRPRSIDKNEEKTISPKKQSPKKANIHEINSGPGIGTSRFFNVYSKISKKEKEKEREKEKNNDESNIKKNTSGNKLDIPISKRKQNNIINNMNSKINNINLNNNNNEKQTTNFIGANNNPKKRFKKSLTINRMYKFKAGEVLEKRKIKEINNF